MTPRSRILDQREVLIEDIMKLGSKPASSLNNWRYKTVRDAITVELQSQKADVPHELYEAFSAYWIGQTEQARITRNEAGHPVSIEPVTPQTVHASLLMFPELSGLCAKLTDWARNHYA